MGGKFTKFSLRTIFIIITILCICCGYAGREYGWIRKRKNFISNPPVVIAVKTAYSLKRHGPLLSLLFGDKHYVRITLRFHLTQKDFSVDAINMLDKHPFVVETRQLFPEADVKPTVVIYPTWDSK